MRQFFNQTKNLTLRKESLNEHGMSSFSDTITFSGYLKPMSRKDAGVNGAQYGKTYLLFVPLNVDIDAGDKVYSAETDTEYNVQAMTARSKQSGSLSYKEVVLVEPL
jgi:hypothetical protein